MTESSEPDKHMACQMRVGFGAAAIQSLSIVPGMLWHELRFKSSRNRLIQVNPSQNPVSACEIQYVWYKVTYFIETLS